MSALPQGGRGSSKDSIEQRFVRAFASASISGVFLVQMNLVQLLSSGSHSDTVILQTIRGPPVTLLRICKIVSLHLVVQHMIIVWLTDPAYLS